jgi:YfiH family protein
MSTSTRAQPLTIGGEGCLAVNLGEACVLYGRGPALGGKTPDVRGREVLGALTPQLSALRWCEQIHGKVSVAIDHDGQGAFEAAACVGRCDGLITGSRGVGLMVWTADCAPVILSGGGVIAAVHSGWRGCATDIVPKVLRRFEIEYGVPSRQVLAAIGPTIGGCHYEVGDEVIGALSSLVPDSGRWRDGRRVDLRAFLRMRLETRGLDPSSISTVGGCTFCDPGLASYRRDGGGAGRQFSMVYRAR